MKIVVDIGMEILKLWEVLKMGVDDYMQIELYCGLACYTLITCNLNICTKEMFFFPFQLGYEPLPAVPSTSIFGRKVLAYPGLFKYCKFICIYVHSTVW